MNKSEQALECCEKVLEGLELGTITISSALLMCIRIARLVNDTDSLIWLQYESGGYPKDDEGYVLHDAFIVAFNNGRGSYNKDKQKVIFTETISELESKIETQKKAICNFSTEGVSTSGEWGGSAMNILTSTVANSTNNMITNISSCERKIAILKSKYYDYALKNKLNYLLGMLQQIFFLHIEKMWITIFLNCQRIQY